MFRVRSMLGDAVGSNPYRFVAGLTGCSDSGRVLRMLHERRVAEALEAYPDQLDLALGSAVRSSADAGLLIRWLSTDMGSADWEAAEALGRLVGRAGTRWICRSRRVSVFERRPATRTDAILFISGGSHGSVSWQRFATAATWASPAVLNFFDAGKTLATEVADASWVVQNLSDHPKVFHTADLNPAEAIPVAALTVRTAETDSESVKRVRNFR